MNQKKIQINEIMENIHSVYFPMQKQAMTLYKLDTIPTLAQNIHYNENMNACSFMHIQAIEVECNTTTIHPTTISNVRFFFLLSTS